MIWDFACEPIPPAVRADLERLDRDLRGSFGKTAGHFLDRFEVDAMQARLENLLAIGEYPDADRDYHSYPWPTI